MNHKRLDARDRSRLIATTSTLILEENDLREWIIAVNQGATDVWLRLGEAAALDTGIYLKANGGATALDMTTFPWYGEVHAIATGAASVVTCQEVLERT